MTSPIYVISFIEKVIIIAYESVVCGSSAPATAFLSFSSQMKAIAIGQDKIGWAHFLEGKVTGNI